MSPSRVTAVTLSVFAGLAGVGLAVAEVRARAVEGAAEIVLAPANPSRKYTLRPGGDVNEWGFRERPIAPGPHPGVWRVAVIGDAATHGIFVPPAQCWPRVLEDKLHEEGAADAQVLQFAVPGYDIESVDAMLTDDVLRWEPDLLLYGAYFNDPSPTLLTRLGATPWWVGTSPRPMGLLGPTVDGALRRHSAAFRAAEGRVLEGYYPSKEEPNDWAWFGPYARALVSHAGSVPLAVLAIPPHVVSLGGGCNGRARQGPGWCDTAEKETRQLARAFEALGVHAIDGVLAYRNPPGQDYTGYGDDVSHPNPAGHERLAAAAVGFTLRKWREAHATSP